MATQLEIVNAALVALGGTGRLAALDSSDPQGEKALSVYDIARDGILSCHWWDFAMRRAQIAAEADAPVFGWKYAYLLPDDCLRVYRLNQAPRERKAWEVEGGRLLSDEPGPIDLRYLARLEDESAWPAFFTDAFVAELASRLALAVANTNTIATAAAQTAQRRLADAKWQDAQQRGRLERELGPLEAAHWYVSD